MTVYIKELQRTGSLYLYDVHENECTEKFLCNVIGEIKGCFEKINDEIINSVPEGINISEVKYAMSEDCFRYLVAALKPIQDAYDNLSDEAGASNKSVNELLEEFVGDGTISKKEMDYCL